MDWGGGGLRNPNPNPNPTPNLTLTLTLTVVEDVAGQQGASVLGHRDPEIDAQPLVRVPHAPLVRRLGCGRGRVRVQGRLGVWAAREQASVVVVR